ncbi:MAG: hypothetical protein Q4G03_08160 [Planctomycetia bacterium]|nr:hypothetical protein [Planctomycetia bacterium]
MSSRLLLRLCLYVALTCLSVDLALCNCARATEPEVEQFGKAAASADVNQLREWFKTAPDILPEGKVPLKGLPLWHTNGELTDEIIHEFFEQGQANGYGGITFLPLTKTTPKYLSEEYLKQYGKALDLADQLGMKVVYYDDLDFPSGSAGWRLRDQFPQSTIKRLDKVEWDVEGPCDFVESSPIPRAENTLYNHPEGVLQAAVAMNTETFERINIRDCVDEKGNVKWSAPDGKWKVMLFFCIADKKGIVDYMSPSAVKDFFSLTYDQFYKEFKDHFGTTIVASFFDDLTNTQTEGGRNWTLGFNDKYRELWGKDADLDYPALFYPIGEETPSARYRLWTTRNRLFEEGYPSMTRQWRIDHNIDMVSTGHPQGPYVIEPIDMSGDAMTSHRGSDAVLFDSIHYYGHGRDGFKIPTSAAYNFDMPLCFVEIYGNYRDDGSFTPELMQRSAMEIFARGGNVLLPHGIWSDPETMYIPPDLSWHNPVLKDSLPQFGQFVSRNELLLQGGKHVADIAVLYPVDNIKAYFHFAFGFITGDYPYGVLLPNETDYLAVGSILSTELWRDFTFIHPDILDQKCSVREARLTLDNVCNAEEYRVFLIPGMDVISLANLEKIARFHAAGGKLIATTRLPSMAAEGPQKNDEVCRIIEEIFGVDPRTQEPRDAIRTGQEDIVLPESFAQCREINRPGEYLPPRHDVVCYEESIERERAVFVPRPTAENLQRALDYLDYQPDVKVAPVEGTVMPKLTVVPRWAYPHDGMFQYLHKVKNGLDVYLLANSSNSTADFNVTLRGLFDSLEFWNPLTGLCEAIPQDQLKRDENAKTTTVHVTLERVQSIYIVGQKTR